MSTSAPTKQISRRDFLKTATKTTAKIAIGAAGVSAVLATLETPASASGSVVNQYNFEGNVNDSVGGKNGTANGSPTYVTGKVGSQAINLSGSTQYVSLPAGIVSSLTTASIGGWIKVTAQVTWARFFDFGSSTTINMFMVPSNGSIARFAITTGASGAEQHIDATSALAVGSWQHVVVTLNGATGTLYINGAVAGTNTAMTLNPSSLGSTTLNYFGKSQYADGYLNAAIDDFRIYNGPLTQAEVQAWYTGGPTITPGGPTNTPLPPTNTPTITPTPAPNSYLSLMYPESGWQLNSTFWNERVKPMIVTWVPWCYNKLNASNCAEGGIQNFIEAKKKIAGQSAAAHVGYWFSNAYVHNTLQSMIRANMMSANGDSAITTAQNNNTTWITGWIPTIMGAQYSDGYMHTWTTLGSHPRWSDHTAHEGYTGGYWLEACLAHYQWKNYGDATLYNSGKLLADCWFTNIGPSPKKTWWDGHEEMEQGLTRFSRFCNSRGDTTQATNYASLAKFLLDSRYQGGSNDYDQTSVHPVDLRNMVGHAVRMGYLASGMTDVAMLNNSSAYFTAVNAIWADWVNTKWYVTGGLGAAHTMSEGFDASYSLPNDSYCETCAGTAGLFFDHMMHLAYADGKYVDLYEESLYNNVVGTMDTAGSNYEYTNPLSSSNIRGNWNSCPCCVGNFPRTIFTMPSWMYSKSSTALYVNLFVGSVVTFNNTFGSVGVTLTQVTNYPWDGTVTLTVSPTTPTAFTLYVRAPQRSVSTAYSSSPASDGITSWDVNGTAQSTTATKGYVSINRTWTAGDVVHITLPLNVQRITAISNITADNGRVALQRGPIVYSFESVDQSTSLTLPSGNALTATWDASLLGGVTKITGTWSNSAALVAVPWYKRCNRGGSQIVWALAS